MKITHDSRSSSFRSPFGAVPIGTDVTLRICVSDTDAAKTSVTLRTWIDQIGEALLPMIDVGDGYFEAQLACPDENIVWYSFIVSEPDGKVSYVGTKPGRTGGEAQVYDGPMPPSFQLTVYKPRLTRPSWYEHGMVYQIFPDRYRRDPEWHDRTAKALAQKRGGIPRVLVGDWGTPASYEREGNGSVAHWDFYGGSLKGIEGDLDRLAELGFTAIYLNPIFAADSNHRYDTGDYLKIDSALGTEEDFRELCEAAGKRGISIILDGVFNHTGDDSIYFNHFGTYPEPGAWQAVVEGKESEWADAYHLNPDGTYDAWWGIGNMPALNENSTAVRNLLLGEDGVIRHWLRLGARGWRLDVADELSDRLLADIKTAALEERSDALVLGEVWEDASNKVSYGKLRRYLLGDELDSAMNYPFRDMVIGLLTGKIDAFAAAEAVESLRENYPHEALMCALNLLGSHDKPRIISVLGGMPEESELTEAQRAAWKLPDEKMGIAKGRFWLATLIQMTFPGVPSIYYGDEAGMQGLSDPCNRGAYPWGHEDNDMLTMIENASGLRRALPFLVDGDLRAFALNEDVLAYTRSGSNGQALTVLINRGSTQTREVEVQLAGAGRDLISGEDIDVDGNGAARLTLYPLGSRAVYTGGEAKLVRPMDRGAGVLCHITSVPTDDGRPGTLGEPARRFVDSIAKMGMRYWQVLPVNPTDAWGSPYAGPSAFAGNTALLDETPEDLEALFKRLDGSGALERDASYNAFCEQEGRWLEPYAAFMAVKDAHKGASRHEWGPSLSRYTEKLPGDPRYADRARFHMFCQWKFDREWRDLAAYAHARGVRIIGDIPMYVSDDSADAWSRPDMFCLGADGSPSQIAGTPPDRFCADGQVWGNPTYRWDTMRRDGYSWWLARLSRALELYDYLRLDHFLGFQSYFSIPAGHTGQDGRWLPGPGIDLFRRAHSELGPLPLIAEDLGYLTPAVRALLAQTGFPGMDVLEFADYDVRAKIDPHAGNILYTSTHDTSTLVGWCEAAFCRDSGEGRKEGQAQKLASDIMERSCASDAGVVMIPLQDLIGLDDSARMNVPGSTGKNWSWQATRAQLEEAVAPTAELLEKTGRR